MQARTFGIPSICIRQFGHAPVMHESPRGRWYLKDRAVIVTPAAASAEPTVSPSNASIVRALETEADRPVAPDRFALALREPFAHAGAASRSSGR